MPTSYRVRYFPATFCYILIRAPQQAVANAIASPPRKEGWAQDRLRGRFPDVVDHLQPFKSIVNDRWLLGTYRDWSVVLGNRMAGFDIGAAGRVWSAKLTAVSIAVALSEQTTNGRSRMRYFTVFSEGLLQRQISYSQSEGFVAVGEPLAFEDAETERQRGGRWFTARKLLDYCEAIGVSLDPENYGDNWTLIRQLHPDFPNERRHRFDW